MTTTAPRRSSRTKLTDAGAIAALAVTGVVWSQRAAPAAPSVTAAPTALVAPGLVEAQGERIALVAGDEEVRRRFPDAELVDCARGILRPG